MEEWGILDKILFSDSRVEGEEKRKNRNSRSKPIKLWTFFNMKRESLLILRSRRRRRVLKISSVRNFNVYRNNIAIIWRNATKMPV